jgi:hypothetical protein
MCADAMGSRVNTREVRMRDQLLFERDTLIKVTYPLIEETKHASDINQSSLICFSLSCLSTQGILKLKPHYVTPPDYIREKPKRKLYIPIKVCCVDRVVSRRLFLKYKQFFLCVYIFHCQTQEYPNYNFIGLVIGPRGVTQKAMEKESGAKIVIRGRGSSKEGAKNRSDGGLDDEDQLHVLITVISQTAHFSFIQIRCFD